MLKRGRRPKIVRLHDAVTKPPAAGGGPYRTGLGRRSVPRSAQAFTLIELMVMLAILTLLVTVAFPLYQQTRDAALIRSRVADLMGYARVCDLINSSGIGATPVLPPVTADRGGFEITAGCTDRNQGATLQASWGTAKASGVVCVAARSQISSSKARITISPGSVLTCTFVD